MVWLRFIFEMRIYVRSEDYPFGVELWRECSHLLWSQLPPVNCGSVLEAASRINVLLLRDANGEIHMRPFSPDQQGHDVRGNVTSIRWNP